MNLVNYIAFGIPSKELHIELYDRMIQAWILKDNQKNDTKTLKESHNQETLSFKRTENYPKDRKTSNIQYMSHLLCMYEMVYIIHLKRIEI
jgi:hypothetical protein